MIRQLVKALLLEPTTHLMRANGLMEGDMVRESKSTPMALFTLDPTIMGIRAVMESSRSRMDRSTPEIG